MSVGHVCDIESCYVSHTRHNSLIHTYEWSLYILNILKQVSKYLSCYVFCGSHFFRFVLILFFPPIFYDARTWDDCRYLLAGAFLYGCCVAALLFHTRQKSPVLSATFCVCIRNVCFFVSSWCFSLVPGKSALFVYHRLFVCTQPWLFFQHMYTFVRNSNKRDLCLEQFARSHFLVKSRPGRHILVISRSGRQFGFFPPRHVYIYMFTYVYIYMYIYIYVYIYMYVYVVYSSREKKERREK